MTAATPQIVVITGASTGVGEAVVRRMGQEPKGTYKLAIVARRGAVLEEVAKKHFHGGAPDVIRVFPCDLTKRDQIKAVVDGVVALWGGIDVWVNNAGRGITKKVTTITEEDCEDMMQVNVYSVLNATQLVLPVMRKKVDSAVALAKQKNSKAEEDKVGVQGHIINISSVLGRNATAAPNGVRSAYSGAKHFLNALTDSLRVELDGDYAADKDFLKQSSPIALTTISPGAIATEFGLNAGGFDSRTLPQAQPVDEVAAVVFDSIDEARTGNGRRSLELYTKDGHKKLVDTFISSKASEQKL